MTNEIIKDILTFEDLLNQTIENGAEIIDFLYHEYEL